MRSRTAVKQIVRDPRLLLGFLLVIGGGILGAFVLTGQEQVAVVRANTAIARGELITDADVVTTYIPVELAGDYVKPTEIIDDDAVTVRSLAAGELVRHDVLGYDNAGAVITIGLVAPPAGELVTGSLVDIWRIEQSGVGEEAVATCISADAVLVRHIQQSGYSDGKHYVEVRVAEADVSQVLAVFGSGDSFAIVKASEAL